MGFLFTCPVATTTPSRTWATYQVLDFRETCQAGVAGVVVTHDARLASWADRVIFLRDGRIVDQTAPADGPESLLDIDPVR